MKRALLRRDPEEGQTAVEMALVLPLLLIFILFLVDLALFGFSYVSVTNAVREGARCGAVGASDAAIVARVEDTSGITGTIDVAPPARSWSIGSDVTVTADYSYSMLTPVSIFPGVSGDWDISKSATMRMETSEESEAGCG